MKRIIISIFALVQSIILMTLSDDEIFNKMGLFFAGVSVGLFLVSITEWVREKREG